MTRFTNETAFKLMPQSHITPNMLMIIIAIVTETIRAAHTSKPSSTVVTKNIDPKEMQRLKIASCTIVRYCS